MQEGWGGKVVKLSQTSKIWHSSQDVLWIHEVSQPNRIVSCMILDTTGGSNTFNVVTQNGENAIFLKNSIQLYFSNSY
jgi:hypothetical protein